LPIHREVIKREDIPDVHVLSSADYAPIGTVLNKNKKIRTLQLDARN